MPPCPYWTTMIEIGASAVVVWELSDAHGGRRQRALRLIAMAFVLLAAYLVMTVTTALGLPLAVKPNSGGSCAGRRGARPRRNARSR